MGDAAEKVLAEALRLSPDDRASIASRLLESVHRDLDPAVEQAWLKEIERRIDALDRGEIAPVPAAEVWREADTRTRDRRNGR